MRRKGKTGPSSSTLGLSSLCIPCAGFADRQLNPEAHLLMRAHCLWILRLFQQPHDSAGDWIHCTAWETAGESGGWEREYCYPSLAPTAHPQLWTPLLTASSFPPLIPPPTPLYTSPTNRAESVNNLTNGFICCQICADLSFPWTFLLDTFHSWVSLLALWLELTVPLQRCAGWELIKRGATAAAVRLIVSWTGSPWSCIPPVSFPPLELCVCEPRGHPPFLSNPSRLSPPQKIQAVSAGILVLIWKPGWRCGVGLGLWPWWLQCFGLSVSSWMGWMPRRRERSQRRAPHNTQRPTMLLFPTVKRSVEASR